MKEYTVEVRCVEAEDGDEAQEIAIDRIDWGDVEFSCEECEEIKVKGEN